MMWVVQGHRGGRGEGKIADEARANEFESTGGDCVCGVSI